MAQECPRPKIFGPSGSRSGFILLGVILLTVFASIVVGGITVFVVQRLAWSHVQQIQLADFYLAQAGIHQALYDFRDHDLSGPGYVSTGQTMLSGDQSFVIQGTDADFLMVDISQTELGGQLTKDECKDIGSACKSDCDDVEVVCKDNCDIEQDLCYEDAEAIYNACVSTCPGGKAGKKCQKACAQALSQDYIVCNAQRSDCRAVCSDEKAQCKDDCRDAQDVCIEGDKLTELSLRNATDSRALTLSGLVVTWDCPEQLEEVVIDGDRVWSGRLSSPAAVDLSPDVTLDANQTTYDMDFLRFTDRMTDATTVSLQFNMTDGSAKTVVVYPPRNEFNFQVRATGRTEGATVYRTMVADYNSFTGEVMNAYEVDQEYAP